MRTTGITGFAFDGTNARYASIVRTDDGGYAMEDRKGRDLGDPFEYEWTTLSRARGGTGNVLLEDGRRSEAAVSMYVIPRERLTSKDGTLRGRFGAFEAFVQSWFDESGRGNADDFRGETYEDRFGNAIGMLTQRVWED